MSEMSNLPSRKKLPPKNSENSTNGRTKPTQSPNTIQAKTPKNKKIPETLTKAAPKPRMELQSRAWILKKMTGKCLRMSTIQFWSKNARILPRMAQTPNLKSQAAQPRTERSANLGLEMCLRMVETKFCT
jgi:hypothetical protein